jgi:hypothetical protein
MLALGNSDSGSASVTLSNADSPRIVQVLTIGRNHRTTRPCATTVELDVSGRDVHSARSEPETVDPFMYIP